MLNLTKKEWVDYRLFFFGLFFGVVGNFVASGIWEIENFSTWASFKQILFGIFTVVLIVLAFLFIGSNLKFSKDH